MASQASQYSDEEGLEPTNALVMASQDVEDFNIEEDDFEPAEDDATQASIVAGDEDEITLTHKLSVMVNNYTNNDFVLTNATVQALAIAAEMENFRMTCRKLDPVKFPKLYLSAKTVASFHAFAETINTEFPGYQTFK